MGNPTATTKHGKPVAVNESCTINGTILSITNTGATATVTVKLFFSGNIITINAADIAATAQTT